MKTPEQLKGAIRNISVSKNLRPQEVLQMFLFERILERLADSRFRSNFILKGGLLISSMIGISERTTMDMDTTVRGISVEEEQITDIIQELLSVDVGDGIHFRFQRIEPIREDDTYNNFRVHIEAQYGRINSLMKIDITTGDIITPAAIRYDYPLLLKKKASQSWHIHWKLYLPKSMKPYYAAISPVPGQEISMIYISCFANAMKKSARMSCCKPSATRLKSVDLFPFWQSGQISYPT